MIRMLRRLVHRRTDDGAVAVEAALITGVIIIPLLFGFIEFSLLLRDNVAITSMVRSGARIASAEPRLGSVAGCQSNTLVDKCFAQDAADAIQRNGSALPKDSIDYIWVYKANATGFPGSQTSFQSCPTTSCYQYNWNTGSNRFTWGTGAWDPKTINACPGVAGDAVGVYMHVTHKAITGLFFKSFTLTDSAVLKFEPIDNTLGTVTCS